MGIFDGISNAKATRSSNYERAGHYLTRIDKFKEGTSRKGDGYLAIEKTVVHVFDDANGTGHKVGEEMTHMLMTKHDSFLGNVKAAVVAIVGCESTEVDSDQLEGLCSDEQPLAGLLVETKNKNIVTQKGGDFTIVDYKRAWDLVEISELVDLEDLKKKGVNLID